MADINATISIIILNVNGLNILIKTQIVIMDQIGPKSMLFTRNSCKYTDRFKIREWRKT